MCMYDKKTVLDYPQGSETPSIPVAQTIGAKVGAAVGGGAVARSSRALAFGRHLGAAAASGSFADRYFQTT